MCLHVCVCVTLYVPLCVCLHDKLSQPQSARGRPSGAPLGSDGEGRVADRSGAGGLGGSEAAQQS